MEKVKNPYVQSGKPDYQCFGCSPDNKIGLHLEFWKDGDDIVAKWIPRKELEGYADVLHGGIQATLLDELASWVVQTRCETVGVTASMNINFTRPVLVSAGEITLRGRVKEAGSRLATIETELFGHDGKLCASATIKYFLYQQDKAIAEYYYPGVNAF